MKKAISICMAIIAIAATLAVCIYAGDGRSLSYSYTYNPSPGVAYTVYYDIGSPFPFDDVRARTTITIYSSQGETEGYARAQLTTNNGSGDTGAARLPDASGLIDSGWGGVAGIDYATSVTHTAHAKVNTQITRSYSTLNP